MGSVYQILNMIKELSCEVLPVDHNEPFPLHWVVVLEQLQGFVVLLQLLMNLQASNQLARLMLSRDKAHEVCCSNLILLNHTPCIG